MKTFCRTIATAALSATLFAPSCASAALIEFTDRAAFNAATSGRIVEPNSAPPGSYTPLGVATYHGITFPNYAYMIDPGYAPDLYDFGTGPILLLLGTSKLVFEPVTAFAADFSSLGELGMDITFTINGQSRVLAMSGARQLTFYGFVSSTAFNSVSLSSDAQLTVLDNVTRATGIATVAVPEPQSLALLGMALAALALGRRRRA